MKKYSHLLTTKIIVFMIMIACFAGAMQAIADLVATDDGDVGIVFEDNYYNSN